MMSKQALIATAVIAVLTAAGCSHRDAATLTPSENSATPTYRSTTNSWEMNSAPKYTQSGVNGGEPATLPAIPSPARFSQNTPLAMTVYSVLREDQKIESRYISVFTKGNQVRLLGTAPKDEISQVVADVKSVAGVKSVENKLQNR